MESKAQLLVVVVTWFLLLAIVAAGVVPAGAGAGAVKALRNESKAATSSSSWTWPTVAPQLEDTVEPQEALPAAGVHHEVHRRVLANGRYLNPPLQANQQRCIRNCPALGGPDTGSGNKCIYHNGECRLRGPGTEGRETAAAGLEPLFAAAADEGMVELEVRRRILQARNPVLYRSLAPKNPGFCRANCAARQQSLPYTHGPRCNKYFMCPPM